MSSDSGLRDDVHAALNEPDPGPSAPQPEPVGDRPGQSAGRAKWVDYCVRLGADRDAIEGRTEHWSDEHRAYMPGAALTRDRLVDLAERLGG